MLIPFVALAVLHLVVQGAGVEGKRRRIKSSASTEAEATIEITTENAAVLKIDPEILPSEVLVNESFARNAGETSPSESVEVDGQAYPNESVTCDPPPQVKGAKPPRVRDKEHDIGAVVTYTCEYGYVGQGSGRFQSTCEFDEQSGRGQWSDPNVVCTPNVTCSRPPQVNGAKSPNVQGKKFLLGRKVIYTCPSGYVSQGPGRFQSVCEFDENSGKGRWSDPNVDCRRRRNTTRKPETTAVHTPSSDPEETIENVPENVAGQDEDPPSLSTEVPERGSVAENEGETSLRKPIKSGDQEHQEQDKDDNVTCDRPPAVEGAIAPRVRGKEHAVGTVVTYLCDFGFVSRGTAKFQSECEKDEQTGKGRWSDPNVVCIPRSCGDPGFVINARRIGSDFTFPHTVEFECEEGYKLNGAGVRYCQASGVWSGKLPTCEQVYCERPLNPENGRVRYIALEYGTELRYECNKGFILSNYQQRYCTENGTWSNEEPVCMEANCDEPQAPRHGFRQLTGGLKVDSLVIYSCEEGKILLGASTSKCLSDGQWTFPPPQCVDHCEVPYVQYGKIGQYEIRRQYYKDHKVFVPFAEGKKVKPNEVIYLRCNKDFVLEEGSKTSEKQITCEDGTWSMPLQCKSVSCDGEPPPMDNGYPVVNIRTHGYTIYYRCNEFFEKTKTGHVECVYGKWEGYTPVCTDVRCYTNQLNFPHLVKPKGEFIAHKKDFSISCEEGYQVTGQKTKISCDLGKWNIDYNPCIEEQVVRCPEIDEKGIFNVRYNNSRRFNSAAHYYCKDLDRKILGFNFRICQDNGEWSGGDPECVEPEFRCPEIDDKGIFTVRYNNERRVNSDAYYFCKHRKQKMFGSGIRTCQEDGKWSGRDPECVAETSSGFSDEKISTSASRPQTASREPSIGESPDSQKQDDCCCTSNYVNTNVLSSDEGEQTLLGTKVKKGDSVEIGCKDRTAILVWRNGLRTSGPVSLTCDTCQTWGEEDIPSCIPLSTGDTWIVLNRNMKLLPGGIIEIRQNDNVQIQCSVFNEFNRMHYPVWRSSPPKTVGLSYNAAGRELRTLMLIDDFKAELTGRYDCSTTDVHGQQYGPTILNLKIATAEMRCPLLDEKDDFIISYSNSRKVNSIAVYFCRKQAQVTRGKNHRTCLESGEWTSEEYPSCVDIICPKFIGNRYVDIWYSNEQYMDSVATFLCRHPRILTGSSTSTCLGNGTWSHSQPTCELPATESLCPEIDEKNSFIINYSNRRKINSVAYYSCKSYSQRIHGSNTRTCQQNGEWSNTDPVCVDITCRRFGVFGSLTVDYTNENKVGSKAEFHCTPPAVLVGSFTARCLQNATWTNPQPSCDEPEIRCPAIDEKDIFTIRYDDDKKVNSAAYYSCREPDQTMKGYNARICQENGEWSGIDPVCVAPGCKMETLMAALPPDVVPNEENVTGELLPAGFELSLLCDNNQLLVGNNKVTCNQQGRWNVGKVQCVLGCSVDSSSSPILIIEPTKDFYRFGEFAVLSCPEDFELTTEVERVMCMGMTGWSDPLPDCKKKTSEKDESV